jgi:hypothetical protein
MQRGRDASAKGFTEQLAFEGRHVPPEDVQRPTIVPQEIVGLAQEGMSGDLKAEIPEGRSDGEGTLACSEGAVKVGYLPELARHVGEDQPQPMLIAQSLG